MKTTLGGERLGSGGKVEISDKTYNRSTHDLSSNWRSSMASGTLVPFMNLTALPGDNFDIDLKAEVLTTPTVGPLFGSYKVQLDVFQVPMRLYNAKLTMNALNIGNNMADIKIPQIQLRANRNNQTYLTNDHVNTSCIHRYLGVTGLGHITGTEDIAERDFNAVPYLAYWDIFKNYYANKQEEDAYVIHTGDGDVEYMISAAVREGTTVLGNPINGPVTFINDPDNQVIIISYPVGTQEPTSVAVLLNGEVSNVVSDLSAWAIRNWDASTARLTIQRPLYIPVGQQITVEITNTGSELNPFLGGIKLTSFPLENIDQMREDILQHSTNDAFKITNATYSPYGLTTKQIGNSTGNLKFSSAFSQEGLAVKTYQSDLFNNWIETEWIDGDNGVNEITAVQVVDGEFTIDALNLASKVYAMLNRVAISGGSYDDWLDAVYDQERKTAISSPVYHGSLIKEMAFEEVISNSETSIDGNVKPLGELAGRGRMTSKNKGGRMKIKVDEPSVIIGIASITPRINYSQGNQWDVNLKSFDDFHKPALDAIGYQDLIAEQMVSSTSEFNSNTGVVTPVTVGKQPAWMNYQTDVDRVYGNFAEDSDMFMILNRKYEIGTDGAIDDMTTYIDPTKFNNIFAQTDLTSQNFWVQIRKDIKARRKMSGRQIPNL